MAKSINIDTTTTAALHAAYEARAEQAAPGSDLDWRRDHLGASVLGHECDRYLWLLFRWAMAEKREGRMLRLFERGHREEAWLIDDLRAAGFVVDDRDPATGEQFRVLFGDGHVGGSLDGIIRGLDGDPRPHVLECKTHSAKSFARLQAKSVRDAKPEHYAQMQVYMLGRGLDRALYLPVCKDDDELYDERILLDEPFARKVVARGEAIVQMPAPPAKLVDKDHPPCVYTSQDGTRWPCRFYDLCHGESLPAKNCRTCIESRPVADGRWECAHHRIEVGSMLQRAGCSAHLTVPDILNAQVTEVDEAARRVTYQFPSGSTHTEGRAT